MKSRLLTGTFRSIAFVAMLLLPAAHALAVNVVFRGDDRAPEAIFTDGFHGPGSNFNVFDHISGESCFSPHAAAARRSAYVGLTEDYSAAQHYGDYVYRIVPDAAALDHEAVHHVVSGLRDLRDNADAYMLDLRQRSTASSLQDFHASVSTYMAMNIPGHWIQSVDQYRYDPDTGTSILVRSVNNPGFRAPARAGTRTIFSGPMVAGTRMLAPPSSITYAVARNGTTATACLLPPANGGCGDSAQSRSSLSPRQAANNWQCAVEPTLGPGSRFNQAVQLLLH